MPGIAINGLPLITTLVGDESFVVQQTANENPQQPVVQITAANVVKSLTPFLPTNFLDAALSAGLNSNVNPVGYLQATALLKLTSPANAAFSVDGIIAPVAPSTTKFLFVVNANTTIGGQLILVDASGSASLAANRILTQAGAGLTLLYNAGVLLWYDPEQGKWRVMG